MYIVPQYFNPLFFSLCLQINPVSLPLSLAHIFHPTRCPYSFLLSFHLSHFFSFPCYIFYLPPVLSSAFIWRLVSQCRSTIWTWNTPETHTQSTTHETHANWETSFLLPTTPLVATFFSFSAFNSLFTSYSLRSCSLLFPFSCTLASCPLSLCRVTAVEVLLCLHIEVCVGYGRQWVGRGPSAAEWFWHSWQQDHVSIKSPAY
jgi:hypothetical protein